MPMVREWRVSLIYTLHNKYSTVHTLLTIIITPPNNYYKQSFGHCMVWYLYQVIHWCNNMITVNTNPLPIFITEFWNVYNMGGNLCHYMTFAQ